MLTDNLQGAIGSVLSFHWGTSRGRDTYGYNICTLKINGQKAAQCNGGGYDMEGTCLGEWIENRFQPELLALARVRAADTLLIKGAEILRKDHRARLPKKDYRPDALYGLDHVFKETETARLDGACGWNSMISVLRALGLNLAWKPTGKKSGVYIAEAFNA